MEQIINQDALRDWDEKHLEEYQLYAQQMVARYAIINAQVQVEWDRRYPHEG